MAFTFPKAGLRAPSPIKRLLARIRTLPLGERRKLPALYRILGSGTPPYKFAKTDVKRSTTPVNDQSCANCNRYYTHNATGTGLCDWIDDVWEPEEWCEYWTKPWTKRAYRAYQRPPAGID